MYWCTIIHLNLFLESVLSDDENDELERSNNNKIEIRRDSEKHDSSSDEEMENELLQGKRALESKPTKFKVVTPHTLREICAEVNVFLVTCITN